MKSTYITNYPQFQLINSFSGEMNFSHDNLYVDGNAADTLSATIMFYEFEKRFPNYYLKPWKQEH